MKKVLIVICLLFVLVGCNKQQVSQNLKDSTISVVKENNDEKNNDKIFIKKKECAELQGKIEAHIAKDIISQDTSAWLNKVFYSQKRNTCMYTMEIHRSAKNNVAIVTYFLIDALTNEEVLHSMGCIGEDSCKDSWVQAAFYFDSMVAEY